MNSRSRIIFYASMILLLALISAFSVIPARADDGAPPPAVPAAGSPAEATTASAPTILSQVPAGTNVVVVNNSRHKVSLASQEAAKIIAANDPIWCPTGVAPKSGLGGCTITQGSFNFVDVAHPGLLSLISGKTVNGTIWILSGSVSDVSSVTLAGLGSTLTHALTINGGWNGISGSTTMNPLTPSVFSVPLIINWSAPVTLNNVTISGATGIGLTVTTTGSILLNNVDAVGNTGGGAFLDNSGASPAQPVTLTGVNVFSENGGGGLSVRSKGAIKASNLVVDENGDIGAYLNNSAAAAQPVTLTGTNEFKYNDNTGLEIDSQGAIALNNITANNTGWTGVYITDNYGLPASPQNVTLTGYGIFNNNQRDGLVVYTYGTISLANITAQSNGQSGTEGYGAFLNNSGGSLSEFPNGNATLPKAVTISVTGSNPDTDLRYNYSGGLVVKSLGAISLTGLMANDTVNGNGVALENDYTGAVGGITIGGWGADSSYNQNGYGWLILSKGSITATSLWGGWNGSFGAYIDNTAGTAAAVVTLGTPGGIGFADNFGDGLDVFSNGAITLNNVNADGNGGNGAVLNNSIGTGAITIKNTAAFSPSFSKNGSDGLDVYSNGTITIMDTDAEKNGGSNFYAADQGDPINFPIADNIGYGVYIDNTGGAGSVIIGTSRANWCNSMSGNFQSGLEVRSNGSVTLSNMCNDNNGGYDSPTGYNDSVDDGYGALVDNSNALTPKPVTLKGTNGFDGNFDTGLSIYSQGVITVNNLYASDSPNALGAYLDNTVLGPTKPQNVTLTGYGTFQDNYSDGLDVLTYGVITTNNLDAENNGGYGAYLDNCYYDWSLTTPTCTSTAKSKGITMNGVNTFNGNSQDGLWATSLGPITARQVVANGNNVDGAYLDNSWDTAVGPITVTSDTPTDWNTFDGNSGNGLGAFSNFAITINNLDASGNTGMGAWLENDFGPATSPQNVTINGSASFYNNGDDGLDVYSYGIITTNNLDAETNGQNNFYNQTNSLPIDPLSGWGVYLDNCYFDWSAMDCTSTAAPKAITMNGTNTFNGNFQDGLWATSYGAITAKQLTANDNGGDGAYLDNQWDGAVSSTSTVTVTSASTIGWNSFGNNGYGYINAETSGDGLEVYSNRAVTLNNIQANGNSFSGAQVDTADHTNAYAANAQNVTFTGRNTFLNNGSDGLDVTADGNITINNLTANGNQDNGAYLENCLFDTGADACAGHGNITLTGTNTFNDNNNGDGLFTDSHGNIAMSKVFADNNGLHGVWGGADGTITVSCGSMTNNGSYGWDFWSSLTVTLKGVYANGNNGGFPHPNTLLGSGTLVTSLSCP
jgi:putative surface-exposed virulence protein